MREFVRKTLSQLLRSEKDGESFAEVLSHWDAVSLTDDLRKQARPREHGFVAPSAASACDNVEQLQPYEFWRWLERMVGADRRGNEDGVLAI